MSSCSDPTASLHSATPALAGGLPDMPITLYERGTAISAQTGTEVLATIVAPYYSRHWDGEHGFVYLPPDRDTGRPAVTLNGQVAHVSHPLFATYWNSAPVPLRQLVANLLERLLPRPLLRAPGAPSITRLTVTAQPGRRLVHVLSYVAERRGAAVDMIEEPMTVMGLTVELRADGPAPARVYLAPAGSDLDFEIVDGYVRVQLERVDGYALIVFESASQSIC